MSPVEQRSSPLHDAALATFPHASLNGVITFAPAKQDALLDLLDSASGILLAINAEKIARGDPTIVSLAATQLGYPDGIGAVLALRRQGIRASRMAGADLWLALIDRYASRRSFHLIGATDEVVARVAQRLRERHPAITLWSRSGYLSAPEEQQLEDELQNRRPDFVLVAMGSPRQELLMQRLYAAHPAVYMGLGGSFDIFAGRKARAPRWLREAGLEWSYRLLREPVRLRVVPALLKFLVLLISGRR
jgi:UDP-N-acetyl-D-mannosaminouronate:lipid I N-acetyl-D-mannosaminouronosyltransferase